MMSDKGRGKFFNYASNPISMVGFVIAGVSALLLIAVRVDRPHGRAPRLVLRADHLRPAADGLRRRRSSSSPSACGCATASCRSGTSRPRRQARWPRLDFNDAHIRKVTLVFLALTFVNAVIFATVSYLGYEFMESPRFCGTVCHTVMSPEYTAYQGSPHSRVACVQCHIGPGASWFVKAKVDGLRQVVATTLEHATAGRSTPRSTTCARRAETCEQCHWPSKHHGDKLHSFVRYADDEANTPHYNAMLIKTGGGDLDSGKHGGIHWWHIYSDNKIRYVQGDKRRISIKWVELTNTKGEVRTYTRKGEAAPTKAEMDEARTMDCIDCHNRPTHLFEFPNKAVDVGHREPPGPGEAPLLQARGDEGRAGQVPDPRRRHEGSQEGDRGLLRRQLPERRRRTLVAEGRRDGGRHLRPHPVFPEMNTNWETHPNHIGHPDPNTDQGFPGCWRCHDDELTTADGKHTIPQDCDNCHTFLVEDSATPPEFASK